MGFASVHQQTEFNQVAELVAALSAEFFGKSDEYVGSIAAGYTLDALGLTIPETIAAC